MPKYRAIVAVLEHEPGDTFTEIPDGIDLEALLASGAIEEAKGADDEKPAKVPCPACVEQELKQPPKFDDLKKLQKHYADRHPALVAPETLPSAAEKEE